MRRRPWIKVLHKRQDYPDNYFGTDQFLNGLTKNLHTRTYSLCELIIASGALTQEFSCVCLFVSLYWFVQEEWLSPLTLFVSSLLVTALGFATSLLMEGGFGIETGSADLLADYVKPAVLFILFLGGVSPVLKTLTESISTDTIWAMTAGMLLAHLIFYNYGSEGALFFILPGGCGTTCEHTARDWEGEPVGTSVSSSISLNAAIFASVCLASRLPSAFHAFVIVSFAVQMFALFPEFRVRCELRYPSTLPLMTLVLVLASACVLAPLSPTGLVFYLLAAFSVTFICPAWLVRLQHLKKYVNRPLKMRRRQTNIYGPWDEATIQT